MRLIFSAILLSFVFAVHSQEQLPLHYTDHRDTTKPLIVYISGDGGMNSFTNTLIKSLNNKGYAVLALDAKDYFWHKKEPQEFSSALSQATNTYLKNKKKKQLYYIGIFFRRRCYTFSYNTTACKLEC